MDEAEYQKKYADLRILKGIQDYLKSEERADTAVYPIKVPNELVYQTLKFKKPEELDTLIHRIFKMGLSLWSERLYNEAFGSEEQLENFIELVKKRTKD
ncbi:MAG: hypothetical protein JRH13_03770 [Deltaproteobacteria bacterium]|nr:hypothetical protein [Deltaproteobacteria bacterium]MBW2016783.1 hypothetical protein [Deltaproteobacteria bacterium]MBW2128465.1 hypothetical protein [Deltaproteobacteria bacterium]MBW2303481.1 hypothetical protein [Deltaproteobacteria bacterium]